MAARCACLVSGLLHRRLHVRSISAFKALPIKQELQLHQGYSVVLSIPNSRRSGIRSIHSSHHKLKVVPFILSDIGEGIRDVVVKEWFIKEGDTVAQFDSVCEVQSDKASVTITSRYDGVVTKLYHAVEDVALVGQPLVDIELASEEADAVVSGMSEDDADDTSSSSSSEEEDGPSHDLPFDNVKGHKVLAAPAVRRIAKENKITLSNVLGTGKDGRVTKEDVLTYLSGKQSQAAPGPPAVAKASQQREQPRISQPTTTPIKPSTAPAAAAADRSVPLTSIQKAMLKTMTEALKIPHFGYCDEVDMSALVRLRSELKGSPLLQGVPFSYMPVIVKATSMALSAFPYLNASLDEANNSLVYKGSHNIGFAMDTADGLLVPNIKNVQSLTTLEVAAEMTRLMELGESGKLGFDDITGGTFSLSNIGSIGGTYAKPVVLPPEVAIGALGKIQVLPRFGSEGELMKAHVMQVSWSADHRVVEGAQMARFSNLWRSYLENPAWMLLALR